MDTAITLATRAAIADSIHRFFHLVDSGQASKTVALFAADARLIFGPGSPKPGAMEGSAIADFMAAREQLTTAFTRHLIGNIMFELLANGEVGTRYMLVLFRSDDDSRSSTPAFVADVAERWTLENDSWKIAERTTTPTFARS